MGCEICKLPENIPCRCHMKYVYYEDENNVTRHSAHQYECIEKFEELCRTHRVDMSKVKNARWGEKC